MKRVPRMNYLRVGDGEGHYCCGWCWIVWRGFPTLEDAQEFGRLHEDFHETNARCALTAARRSAR